MSRTLIPVVVDVAIIPAPEAAPGPVVEVTIVPKSEAPISDVERVIEDAERERR